MSKIFLNLDESRQHIPSTYIRILKNLRHVSWKGGSIMFESLIQAFWTEASVTLNISPINSKWWVCHNRGKIVIRIESICKAVGTLWVGPAFTIAAHVNNYWIDETLNQSRSNPRNWVKPAIHSSSPDRNTPYMLLLQFTFGNRVLARWLVACVQAHAQPTTRVRVPCSTWSASWSYP
jgi:hypothetical protein